MHSINDFTYGSYINLLSLIRLHRYDFANYHDYHLTEKPCILRHDVDFSIDRALNIAKIEKELEVKSTFFFLLKTDFYNAATCKNIDIVQKINSYGHEIGLHYDEKQYSNNEDAKIVDHIQDEVDLLSRILDIPIKTVSMHRPSEKIISNNICIPNVINSYNYTFINTFKYVSDSRHTWRENIEDLVSCDKYKCLHILTHPFWYRHESLDCKCKLISFIDSASKERFKSISENFKNLCEFINEDDKKW